MNTITTHHTNDANRAITIEADERDPYNGNAAHDYRITVANGVCIYELRFQHGPIGEVGVNGLTNEALLAVVIDRLQGFQTSKFACRENALALTKLQEAAMWLEFRTKGREARGVEGTHKP
jgi:hypothetical protein